MVINLRNVLSEVENPLLFNYKADFSDYDFYGIKPFKSGVRVQGRIEKHSGFLSLDMDIKAELDTLCASCGRRIIVPLEVETHNLLVTHTETDDNDEYIIISNDEVDLDSVVTEAVTFNMDSRPLCKEDCKGICAVCGADLNNEACRCKKPLNPVFEKLKDKFFSL